MPLNVSTIGFVLGRLFTNGPLTVETVLLSLTTRISVACRSYSATTLARCFSSGKLLPLLCRVTRVGVVHVANLTAMVTKRYLWQRIWPNMVNRSVMRFKMPIITEKSRFPHIWMFEPAKIPHFLSFSPHVIRFSSKSPYFRPSQLKKKTFS